MGYDAVIVGAGVSGLSVGALLARAGKKVLLLERGEIPGGRAESIDYKNHIVDNGPHGFSRVGHLEDIFAKIGKPFPERFGHWAYRTETYRDGKWVDTRELFSPKALNAFIGKYVKNVTYEELEKYDDISLKDFVYERTDDEGLRLVLWQLGQAICVETLYEQISAGETLFFIKEHLDKGKRLGEMGSVVVGGLRSVYMPLVQTIEENDGQIKYNATVSDVIIENGAAKGVEFKTGKKAFRAHKVESEFVDAPIVVVTTPVWELFDVLCEDDFPSSFVDMINNLRHKTSYIWTIIYGTKEPLWDWHALRWIPMLPNTNYQLMSCCFDPYGEKVRGHQAHLLFQANFTQLPSLFEMNRTKNRRAMKRIFRTFESEVKKLYPNLDEVTSWKIYHAAAYSLAQAPGYVGKHRPEMVVPGVKNLFLVSDTIREGRGMGMQAAARAALICVEKILAT